MPGAHPPWFAIMAHATSCALPASHLVGGVPFRGLRLVPFIPYVEGNVVSSPGRCRGRGARGAHLRRALRDGWMLAVSIAAARPTRNHARGDAAGVGDGTVPRRSPGLLAGLNLATYNLIADFVHRTAPELSRALGELEKLST